MKSLHIVIVAVISVITLSALADLDAAKCKIPERFKHHPMFTTRHCSVNFGFLARRGYFSRPDIMAQPARIKAAGANWVILNTHFCQETFASQRVFLDFDWSSSEMELTAIIQELHRQGLNVLLKPCLTCLDSSWMGAVKFPAKNDQQIQGVTNSYWQTWFSSLRQCLQFYAEIAEKTGVEGLIIGAEYNGTTDVSDEWLQTIAYVRKYYSGPLTYEFMLSEANEKDLSWMKALDFLSISTYPSGSGETWEERYDRKNWKNRPVVTLESIKQKLAEHRQAVADLSKKFDNMPILFTEIGARSCRGSTLLPWEAWTESLWDGEEQANYMEAVFQTFSDLPCWMGLSWWKWDETQTNRKHYSTDPLKDCGFTIYGKPAAKVMAKWSARGTSAAEGFGDGVTTTVKPGHNPEIDPFLKKWPKQYLAVADTAEQQQALYRELWQHDPKAETRLWPKGKVPYRQGEGKCRLDCGELWQRNIFVRDVNDPFFVFYPVKGKVGVPAAVVCPGGGYRSLGWNKEGVEIARWLNAQGFAAAVLLYRVPNQREAALADVQRALRILRAKASTYQIDPCRIGVIGFSAGANLAARAATNWRKLAYERVDGIDDISCRPDFQLPIYLWDVLERDPKLANSGLPKIGKGASLAVRERDYPIDAQTPPAFLAQAEDDFCRVETSIGYHLALKNAGVASELHVFKSGGHGYGLRQLGTPCDGWSALAAKWLEQFKTGLEPLR